MLDCEQDGSTNSTGTRRVSTSVGMSVLATTQPAGPVLDAFYAGYDRAFVLANEKEDQAGFEECLALNHGTTGAALEARYGRFQEVVMVAHEGSVMVGGANFIAYPWDCRRTLLANLNYLYVLPEQRRRGHLARLVQSVAEVARTLCGVDATAETLIFIEQNDPLKMSREDYEHDTRYSGLDQLDRLGIWARFGALIVDFPYVQPPLSSQQSPDETLLYSVLGSRRRTLDACLLQAHLERFFGISVLKGRDLASSACASAQVAKLAAACAAQETIDLLDPHAAIAHARHSGVERARQVATDMRQLARSLRK
jgi:GNAT superfamily N-acetyltransferase